MAGILKAAASTRLPVLFAWLRWSCFDLMRHFGRRLVEMLLWKTNLCKKSNGEHTFFFVEAVSAFAYCRISSAPKLIYRTCETICKVGAVFFFLKMLILKTGESSWPHFGLELCFAGYPPCPYYLLCFSLEEAVSVKGHWRAFFRCVEEKQHRSYLTLWSSWRHLNSSERKNELVRERCQGESEKEQSVFTWKRVHIYSFRGTAHRWP